jgi:hypothetical protein
MNEGANALVFWILVPLFVAVGLYLIWYSRRRKKMLKTFAKTHQLLIRPEQEQALQKTLDSCFSLKNENLVRSFGQLSSLVDGGNVWVFRAVELLDLNPHSQSYSTHFSRIVALFGISTSHDEFFILDNSMQARPRIPGSNTPSSEVTEISQRLAASHNARHALSVTLNSKHGLIYFEPLGTGGEALSDVESLYSIANNMYAELSGNV